MGVTWVIRWYIMNYIEGVKYIVVVWGPSPVGCRQFIEAFLAGLGGGGRRTAGWMLMCRAVERD